MDITKITVPTILDPEYASIATHQGSWAAYEFVKHSKSLRRTLLENDIHEFMNIYKDCLETATRLKKILSKSPYWEDIDSLYLMNNYEGDIRICLKTIFLKQEGVNININNIIQLITGDVCLIVSKSNKIFTIIPYYGMYIICDSKLNTINIVNNSEIKEIIYSNNDKGVYIKLFHSVLW